MGISLIQSVGSIFQPMQATPAGYVQRALESVWVDVLDLELEPSPRRGGNVNF